ncbi:MAG: ribonuclease HI family protein [Candidatus Paceibacterota bacterium]|jgi:ribonuclease HI
MEKSNTIIVYCDGGSRGNPGPAALGIVISSEKEEKGYSHYLGESTNNDAEYQAIIFALKKIKHLFGNEKAGKMIVEIKSDSELAINQLNGTNKIKEKNLQELFVMVWNLKQDFKEVNFSHIPREENKKADKLVNQELDSQKGMF